MAPDLPNVLIQPPSPLPLLRLTRFQNSVKLRNSLVQQEFVAGKLYSFHLSYRNISILK